MRMYAYIKSDQRKDFQNVAKFEEAKTRFILHGEVSSLYTRPKGNGSGKIFNNWGRADRRQKLHHNVGVSI